MSQYIVVFELNLFVSRQLCIKICLLQLHKRVGHTPQYMRYEICNINQTQLLFVTMEMTYEAVCVHFNCSGFYYKHTRFSLWTIRSHSLLILTGLSTFEIFFIKIANCGEACALVFALCLQ